MSRVTFLRTLLLLGGGALGLNLLRTARTGNRLSVNILNMDAPQIKGGAVALKINVAIDNPTPGTIRLKKPYLTAFFKGEEIGNSIPSDEEIDIGGNGRTVIKGISLQLSLLKLGASLLSKVAGQKTAIDLHVRVVANGIPYTDKQHFEF